MSEPLTIQGVLETCLYVDDLKVAERFYQDVLQLPVVSRQPGRHVFLRCGQAMLLLFDPHGSRQPGDTPPHGAQGPGHVAFRVAQPDIAAWRDRLTVQGIDVEQEIAWPQGGHSLYFRDPAGNSLELATPGIWGFSTID
jgi:catechol 2,3-dioxygenase-like lactoylglutathione lyase family enzyme